MRQIFGPALLFCILFCMPLCSLLCAQEQHEYKGWPIAPKVLEEEGKTTKARAVNAALRAGSVDRASFSNYFGKYYFHRWTLPENATQLSTYVRRDFLDNDLKNSTGDARKYLLDMSSKALRKMKGDPKVYPAARLNAMVALGLLYEDRGETKLYPAAFPALIEEYRNPQSPDYLKIAALMGMIRYANLESTDPKLKSNIAAQVLLKLAAEKTSESVADQEIYLHFYRVKAVEGLAGIFRGAKKGQDGKLPAAVQPTIDALLKLIEDEEEPDVIRYAAATSLAQAHLVQLTKDGTKVDSSRLAGAIMLLAKHACTGETEFVKNVQRSEQVRSSTSGGGMGGMGGSMGPSMGGDDYGGMSGGLSGGMSGGYGGSGNLKSENRIRQCIGSSKYAFGSIRDLIRGLAASRNEAGTLALLNAETAPEKTATAKLQHESLSKIDEKISTYFKFLDEGPLAGGKQTPGRGGRATGATLRPGGSGAKTQASNAPKVSMRDIETELTVMLAELEEIITNASPEEVATTSKPASF